MSFNGNKIIHAEVFATYTVSKKIDLQKDRELL